MTDNVSCINDEALAFETLRTTLQPHHIKGFTDWQVTDLQGRLVKRYKVPNQIVGPWLASLRVPDDAA